MNTKTIKNILLVTSVIATVQSYPVYSFSFHETFSEWKSGIIGLGCTCLGAAGIYWLHKKYNQKPSGYESDNKRAEANTQASHRSTPASDSSEHTYGKKSRFWNFFSQAYQYFFPIKPSGQDPDKPNTKNQSDKDASDTLLNSTALESSLNVPPYPGARNYNAASCHLNSVLSIFLTSKSVLRSIPTNILRNIPKSQDISINFLRLAREIRMRKRQIQPLRPQELHRMISKALGENEYMQQDVSDTFRSLMEKLKEKDVTRQLTELFSHTIETRRRCLECGEDYEAKHARIKQDINLLETESNDHIPYTSLDECLKQAHGTQELYDVNPECHMCKARTMQAKLGEKLKNAPKILAFELNRKSLQKQENGRLSEHKLMHNITIPKELDMEQFSNDSPLYELKSFIVHQGETTNYGHYYAYAKMKGIWHCINDEHVTEVKNIDKLLEKTRHTATPCMLFYEKYDQKSTLEQTRSIRKPMHDQPNNNLTIKQT